MYTMLHFRQSRLQMNVEIGTVLPAETDAYDTYLHSYMKTPWKVNKPPVLNVLGNAAALAPCQKMH